MVAVEGFTIQFNQQEAQCQYCNLNATKYLIVQTTYAFHEAKDCGGDQNSRHPKSKQFATYHLCTTHVLQFNHLHHCNTFAVTG